MGIRFYCPNGHKLHVKEFQAGRRGVCPYCGVDVDIPMTNTRESTKGKSTHKRSEEDDAVNLNAISPDVAPDAVKGGVINDRFFNQSVPETSDVSDTIIKACLS